MSWENDPTWTSQALMGSKLIVSHCNVNAFGSSPSAPLIHKGSWGCKDHHMWTCSLKRPSKKNRNGTYYTSTAIRVSAAAPPSLLLAWHEYRPKSPGLTIRVCLRSEPKRLLYLQLRIYENCSWCKVLTFALFSCCPWLWPPLPFSIQPLVWANLCKKVVFCFNVSGDSNVEQVFSCS